jgi:hypothetical protein
MKVNCRFAHSVIKALRFMTDQSLNFGVVNLEHAIQTQSMYTLDGLDPSHVETGNTKKGKQESMSPKPFLGS